jgi:predicted phage baseplate assembly protein
MSQSCGCCAGIQIITPETEANPPGLSALRYRVGTYATFYETMLARLSSLSLSIPSPDGSAQTIRPLQQLTTREPSDPSIALLDAWAIVGDVLTFYQERIANEGYLPTAVERQSMIELARLVNYIPRPGVSASVYLAFTMLNGFSGTVPAGTRAQSVPGSGQTPQYFETSADLSVSDKWNSIQPRLTRPQIIAAAGVTGLDPSTLRSLYFQGFTTNIKIGDGVIIIADKNALRVVDSVTPQNADQRTLIHFRKVPTASAQNVTELAQSYRSEAARSFQGNRIANIATQHLSNLVQQTQPAAVVAQNIQQLQTIAAKRNLTRLSGWLTDLSGDLKASVKTTSGSQTVAEGSSEEGSALGQLDDIMDTLAMPPAVQPSNSVTLTRTVSQAFSPQSDIAPQLLAAFNPAVSSTLYQAWGSITQPSGPAAVYAARVKAGIFANNFAGATSVVQSRPKQTDSGTTATTTSGTETTTSTTITLPVLGDSVRDLISSSALTGLPLDAAYDQIAVGSWVAIDRPSPTNADPNSRTITFHQVENVQTVSRETVNSANAPTGFTAKVTQLSLNPQWLSDITQQAANKDTATKAFEEAMTSTPLLRGTVIYAQAEALALAEEPIETDVQGSTIELDGLYDGLKSGRWIIVSGDRTDIPGTTGVEDRELVMIAGVSQAASSPGDTVHTTLTLANNGLAYSYDNSTVSIYGNVTEATNGQTVGEVLGNGDASQAFQTFALHQSPLTYLSAATPAGAESTLTIAVNEIEWQETDDLSALDPTDHEYTTLTDDSAQTSVIFGNGQNGARVPTGVANVKAVYRYGIGAAGNVDAQQISQLATQPGGVQSVINPLPASGGADADTASQARANMPLAVMALDRLVSVQDYADFSRSYAGIGKAAAAKLSNGRRQVVFVTIAGAEDIPILPTSDLYRNLLLSLQQFGDPHQPILVGVRKAKLLLIAAGIQVLPNYQFDDVEPNVRAALLSIFAFDQRNLGQAAFLSEAISAMQSVAGVAFVNVTIFDSVAESVTASQLASLSTTLILCERVAAKLAYVDSNLDPTNLPNPSAQDYFQIQPTEIVYLTPAIQDTLILTEITPTQSGPKPGRRKRASAQWVHRSGGSK